MAVQIRPYYAISDLEEALEDIARGTKTSGEQFSPAELKHVFQTWDRTLRQIEKPNPIRIIHHFACSGGTIISRAIALMPNVQLLSEIDPLSTLHVNRKAPYFAPTDLILNLRHSIRPVDEAIIVEVFLSALLTLHSELERRGYDLVLRDHIHSHYCTYRNPRDRRDFRSIIADRHPVRSIITVRHPLDSFLSLVAQGWHVHFDPSTLDEYSRRYHLFLDDHARISIFKYEDFVADKIQFLRNVCSDLEIDYIGGAEELLPIAHLTGDSGRSADTIAFRPRRAVPSWISESFDSENYRTLCKRLDYDPIK